MKYFTRLEKFKANNVEMDINTMRAYSYGWWRFTDIIGGQLVFNTYRYSPTTGNHQSKIRGVLLEYFGLSYDSYIEIECPSGLQNLQSGIDYYLGLIKILETEINRPRSQKKKNIERQKQIKAYAEKIETIKVLMKKQD